MIVEKNQLAALCRKYGVFIQGLPSELSGPQLLWAISGNETDFGQNCVPRHEIEYCPQKHIHSENGMISVRAGKHSMQTAHQIEMYHEFGCHACQSYTPWQIMAANAQGYSPLELLNDLDKGAEATLGFLNRLIVGKQQTLTIEEIARLWNGAGVSIQYIDDLKKHYQALMPLP